MILLSIGIHQEKIRHKAPTGRGRYARRPLSVLTPESLARGL